MQMPAWAAAGTFSQAWRAAKGAQAIMGTEDDETLREGLADARVISISREQVDALPRFRYNEAHDEAATWLAERQLPFETMYLSLDHAAMPGCEADITAAGVYLEHAEARPDFPLGGIVGVPFVRYGDKVRPVPFTGVTWTAADGWHWTTALSQQVLKESEDFHWLLNRLGTSAMHRAAAVLYLIDAENVELVPGEPTRQERRAASRSGGEVALTVHIRQARRRSVRRGSRRDFSHRFEVRGHYKHVTKGKHVKPETMKTCSRCGLCRREWVPPHVKGPDDRPFVPKVRHIS